eukprot:SAG22_NODE_2032_length_3108_cov_2.267531_4_plen_209_part_00
MRFRSTRSSLLFAVSGLGLALAQSFSQLVLMRTVIGLAIGVASEAVPVYVAEMTSAERRGRVGTVFQLMVVVGILGSAVTDLALAGSANWRLMFGLSVLPAAGMLAGMLQMPESPRWLVANGRGPEAAAVLAQLRGSAAVRSPGLQLGTLPLRMSSKSFPVCVLDHEGGGGRARGDRGGGARRGGAGDQLGGAAQAGDPVRPLRRLRH